MGGIDYEAEYNNRARVPEHPGIIQGWARDAAAYREAAGARFSTLPYGPSERQAIDLFEPERPGGGTAVFIHGGYWQGLDRSFFSHLARGLNEQGVAVALPGYDLCPQVRVGDIVDQIRAACRALSDRGPLVVAGHSAGGHLAACMLATDWRAMNPELPRNVAPAAYAISGLFDLRPLLRTKVNGALGLDEAEARRLSPLFSPPAEAGLRIDAVVGAAESGEYLRQSREFVEAWGAAGAITRFEAAPGADHFTVIAPLEDSSSGMCRRLHELAWSI